MDYLGGGRRRGGDFGQGGFVDGMGYVGGNNAALGAIPYHRRGPRGDMAHGGRFQFPRNGHRSK
jgi:hypothetical protein